MPQIVFSLWWLPSFKAINVECMARSASWSFHECCFQAKNSGRRIRKNTDVNALCQLRPEVSVLTQHEPISGWREGCPAVGDSDPSGTIALGESPLPVIGNGTQLCALPGGDRLGASRGKVWFPRRPLDILAAGTIPCVTFSPRWS